MATKMSAMFGRTLREAPTEAESANHQLLLRAGLIAQLSAGVYSYLPLAWRSLRKVEGIIREEMDAAGAQELLMPIIQPVELWRETGRDEAYGDVLFRLRDRRDHDYVLAPTHEESVTDLVRRTVQSYRDLPVNLYQIQHKFRDEPRPRGGLVRVRQFIMKDAYSFDIDEEGFQRSYDAMTQAYTKIFDRCHVPTMPVEADSGAIGGKISQEFVFLSEIGEDTIAVCPNCRYGANTERAEFQRDPAAAAERHEQPQGAEPLPMEEVATPGIATIEALSGYLRIPPRHTAKAIFYLADGEPIFAVIRGDLEVNEVKLANLLGARDLHAMDDAEVAAAGWTAGYASPVGLDGARAVADISIPDAPNLVAGANRPDTHLRNVNYGRDWTAELVADIGLAREGLPCPRCGEPLELHRAIELGHIFKLGTVYSEKMSATFSDAAGEQRLPIMGCYGIGVERLLASVIEANHDDDGIRWPRSVAPYDVHIVAINADAEEIRVLSEAVVAKLEGAGYSVLVDDRDERPGVKFKDADLLGMPLRLTLSPRNLKADVVEVKPRHAAEAAQVARSDLLKAVAAALGDANAG